jgi:hypothetical protein
MPVTAGAQVRHSTQPPPDDGSLDDRSAPSAGCLDVGSAEGIVARGASLIGHPRLPAAQVIRQRDESPTAESPIHFVRLALAVRPGAQTSGACARPDQAKTGLTRATRSGTSDRRFRSCS